MDEQLKRRLVGAAVLVALAVLFLPMLFDDSAVDAPSLEETNLPPRPDEEGFSSRIIPLDATEYAAEEPHGELVESPAALLDEVAATAEPQDPVLGVQSSTMNVDSSTRVGVTAWVIQVGSFLESDNAAALEERLKSFGYRAFVEKVYGDKGPVHRVRVGPELMRSDADVLRDKLEKEAQLSGMVVRYP